MTSIICMSISHIPLLNAVSPLYLICYTLNIKYNVHNEDRVVITITFSAVNCIRC